MDVGPVDDGPDEGVFGGELGDVTETAEGALLAPGLEAETHPHRLHLGADEVETGPNPIHQHGRILVVGAAEVDDNDRRTEPLPQLHRVLHGMHRLPATLLVGKRQPDEIRSVHREPEITLGGEKPERLTSLLLPGESLSEGKLQRPVALGGKTVEERLVRDILTGKMGDPEADRHPIVSDRTAAIRVVRT